MLWLDGALESILNKVLDHKGNEVILTTAYQRDRVVTHTLENFTNPLRLRICLNAAQGSIKKAFLN